jgi:hypothetical protein
VAKAALTRRGLLAGAGMAVTAVAACSWQQRTAPAAAHPAPGPAPGSRQPRPGTSPVPPPRGKHQQRQPQQLQARPLGPGERPPQFVVFSWDGAGETGLGLFERFRTVARDVGASMTFFLSGLYLLPRSKRFLYQPPHKPVGASAIAFLSDGHIKATLRQLRAAWLEGHEIGTHFNGHFCDAQGVGTWSSADWRSEIDQAVRFVTDWRSITGFTDVAPLPFDYRRELVGGRTPCLLGQRALLPTAAALHWRYDASSPGGDQVWPDRLRGLWNLPLQSIPLPGGRSSVLSMDYNFMYVQSGGSTRGDPSRRATWQVQATRAYVGGFLRAYHGNRAPFFVGNHFESWNGGIYMNAVEEAIRTIASYPEVRLVSFRQLCDWLDVQHPAILRRLRTLDVGQTPHRWKDYTDPAA